MIYGLHRTKGAPVLGARPGEEGPFGRRPEQAADTDAAERDQVVPVPREGSEQ